MTMLSELNKGGQPIVWNADTMGDFTGVDEQRACLEVSENMIQSRAQGFFSDGKFLKLGAGEDETEHVRQLSP